MKAIILNSGIGKRLFPLTRKIPKCLVNLNGKSILEYQLISLKKHNITDIIMTTGPFEKKIIEFISNNFPELKVKYVFNPKFRTTNYIYSLYLTKDYIDDNVLMLHGDLVFDNKVLDKIINCKKKNCALLNRTIPLPKKDFKGRIETGYVKEIGINVFGNNCYFLAPIYKLTNKAMHIWLNEIANFVIKKDIEVYAENAFNNISANIKLFPLFYSKEFCMEIDDLKDLEIAKKYFSNLTHS